MYSYPAYRNTVFVEGKRISLKDTGLFTKHFFKHTQAFLFRSSLFYSCLSLSIFLSLSFSLVFFTLIAVCHPSVVSCLDKLMYKSPPQSLIMAGRLIKVKRVLCNTYSILSAYYPGAEEGGETSLWARIHWRSLLSPLLFLMTGHE